MYAAGELLPQPAPPMLNEHCTNTSKRRERRCFASLTLSRLQELQTRQELVQKAIICMASKCDIMMQARLSQPAWSNAVQRGSGQVAATSEFCSVGDGADHMIGSWEPLHTYSTTSITMNHWDRASPVTLSR